jgi:hypothetical protein
VKMRRATVSCSLNSRGDHGKLKINHFVLHMTEKRKRLVAHVDEEEQ